MMVEASIEQHNSARHVAEDTMHSLNLKLEDNLNEYIILIVGNHDEGNLFTNLLMITSEDHLKAFNDIDISLRFIDSMHHTNIFLIISGTLGETYAAYFDTIPQILCLYVYCMDKNKHTKWSKKFRKIRCTDSNLLQLLTQLHFDIKQLSGRWPFCEKTFQKTETITSGWYHLFLLAISRQPQHIGKSYREMLDECRVYYRKNASVLKDINYFAQNCNSYSAIREYTKDTFLHYITNRALRTQNMEIILKFRPFISDLNFQLHENYKNYCKSKIFSIRAVYRGQALSINELEYLRSVYRSRNPVITLTTFGSASLNPEVAMNFLPIVDDRIPCLFEIIIPDEYSFDEDVACDNIQAFANISSMSVFPNEEEVLFSLLTHFRVQEVGDLIVQSDSQWVPITLELIRPGTTDYGDNHLNFLENIKKEKNPQHYLDILNLLKEVTEDEVRFNNMNWKKWWSILKKQWGTDAARDQPLFLTLCQCFREHKYYSRKAVEMHKDILCTIPCITSNQSSISYILRYFESCHRIPTKQIALYEQYLKQLCTTNTKESIQCLFYAGLTYEKISDKERALECYETILALDMSNIFQKNDETQWRIKNLKKPSKTDKIMKNERTIVVKTTAKESLRMNEVQPERTNDRNIESNIADKLSIETRLRRLAQYLENLDEWYDMADSKIIFRLPYGNTSNLSVNDYRFYFLSAVKRHILSNTRTTDATSNIYLSRWRYKKYMHEWILLKALENFLQPFKKRSEYISKSVLPQLERFLKKLSVLITLCTVYICIKQRSGKLNVNKVQFIDFTNTETRQIDFFDLRDDNLLHSLKELEEKCSAIPETSITIPDHERIIRMTLGDFIGNLKTA